MQVRINAGRNKEVIIRIHPFIDVSENNEGNIAVMLNKPFKKVIGARFGK